MTLLDHHALPAGMPELGALAAGAARWSAYLSLLFADAAANLADRGLRHRDGSTAAPRLFDACKTWPAGAAHRVPILWNAFPRRLRSRFGREAALEVADMLWPAVKAETPDEDFDPRDARWGPLMATAKLVRPQDEYCEWRVERDPSTQDIRRIVFTTESPESWWALHGTTGMYRARKAQSPFPFDGDPHAAAAACAARLGHAVNPADLQWQPDAYAPLNRWNTSDGIVHLTHPRNFLTAQMALIAESMVPRCDAGGRLITQPQALCCALPEGDPNNHSDSTISGTVNALARQGAWLTLAEPLGVVIADIDTQGWTWPDGSPAQGCWQASGAPGQIQRLVVAPPPGCGFALHALRIGGEPLRHGGQVAECITLQVTAVAVLPPDAQPLQALPAARAAFLSATNRHLLVARDPRAAALPGLLPAFQE